MTWREQLLIKILLLVARIVADDPAIAREIQTLATHVSAQRTTA